MHKSKWLNSLLALLVVFISFSALTGEYENEEDLIKAANKHFSKGEYAQCVELFSQLVSNHPQNANYNYKYGTCLLYSTEDKEQAIKFLQFSINKGGADPEAFFYYGRALHLNYQFTEAKAQYVRYRSVVKPKVAEKVGITAYISQCKSAEKLIDEIQKINVVSKKKVNRKEFFRSYRLTAIKRNIIVKPAEFQTKEDKKAKEYSLIVHNPMNDVIYVSGYNKKDGMGGKDIFKIQKMPDGTFSLPINVGPNINTSQDEDFPYLHPNGRVLYFASKGHNSIGGYDIFRSELDTLLNLWGKAENVGFAVNSPDDDLLYVSDMDENIAYFASARENKQGEITVYKILPNASADPAVIVRGEVQVVGNPKNDARIVAYNNEGEEIGVYNAHQQSGAFTMTLDEKNTYTLGLSFPGVEEKRVKLAVPAKSQASIISKSFILEGGTLKVVDNSAILADAATKKKILAESAKLDVNQTKDIEFNTKMAKKKPKTTPVVEEPVATNNEEVANETVDLTASAEEELKEITDQEATIKKQIDATYFVAQKKRIKSKLIKDEIEELSEELADAYSESDKQAKRDEISQKQTELKISTTEAVSAMEFAQAKEKELKIKAKEKESAQGYLDAVKTAESSNNSASSIAAIEKARDDLDVIQQEIKRMQEDDGSAKTLAKVDAARKNVADKELAFDEVEQDVADIQREQKDLADQADATRNKGLKEELNLQIKELEEELKGKQVERGVRKAAVTEAKSELAVLESSKNIFAEIQEESEDESLVVVTEEQKAKIQQDVAIVVAEEKIKNEAPKEIENTNTVDAVNSEIESAYKEGEVTAGQQYDDELNKAEIKRQELATIREEKELMELSLLGPGTSREKKSIQEKIDELAVQESQAIKDVRVYVEKAKAQEKNLSATERSTYSDKIAALDQLDESVTGIEKNQQEKLSEVDSNNNEEEVTTSTPEVVTKELVIDVETATDTEIDDLIENEAKLKSYEFSSNNNWEGAEQMIESIDQLKKEAIGLLKESNTTQIEAEKGGDANSDKAQKIKEKAYAKLFEATALEGELKEKQFTANRDLLEKEIFSSPEMSTDELKNQAKDVSELWTSASVRRKSANDSKDPVEKIKLANEASELEQIAIKAQKELTESVEARAEKIEADKAELEQIASQNTQEVVPTTLEVESTNESVEEQVEEVVKVEESIEPTGSESVSSSEEPKEGMVENGFGINRNEEFSYGPSSKTKNGLLTATSKQDEADDFYKKAQALKLKANNNPEEAKKYNKEADKLLKKGAKVQEEANEEFQKVNAAELSYNDEEINFALENDDIVKKDSAIIIANEAKDLFASAQTIRKQASKEKDQNKSTALINEAYKIELEALNKQNYVLNGELDGEEEDELEVVVVAVKKEENEYTRKAASIRTQADNETDETKKRELFVEARRYDLAGNTKRTKRMQQELTADKIVFENNKNIVITSREQSNNNTPANKAFKLEQEADSLFKLAESYRIKAANNSDQVIRIEQIDESRSLMAEAKEIQAASIRKYQESKSAPAEPNFVAVFRKDDVSETLAKVDEVTNEIGSSEEVSTEVEEIVDEIPNEEIAINEPEVISEPEVEIETATETQTEIEEPEISVNEPTEVTNEVAVNEPVVDSPAEEVLAPSAVQVVKDSYKELTTGAKSIEMQEVARVERIEVLNEQSRNNKQKSEELLSTVDDMEDEAKILETIAKANSYRSKAEEQEVEAKNEEIILKNNIAEGAAMRKEADLILSSLKPEIKDDILKENENTSPELQKIQEFLTTENETEVAVVNEPVIEVEEVQDPVIDKPVVEVETEEIAITQSANPNLEGATILGSGNTEAQLSKDEFVMNSNRTYSSSDDIPIDGAMPKGIIYQVQVGAFKNKIDPSIFNGLSPLVGEKTATGIIRYKVGYFRGFKSANMAKGSIRELGYRDAFVVVFFDGKRITMEDAQYVIDNAEESEKFVYENLVLDEVQKLKQLGISEDAGELDPSDVSSSPVVVNTPSTSISSTSQSVAARSNGLENDLLKVGGVFYTVQVGVFRSPRLSADLNGVKPLMTEKLNNGLLRYTSGVYRDYPSADSRKVAVRNQGISDAFVIAYNGTKKVSTTEARALASSATNESSAETTASNTDEILFKVQVGAYRAPIVVENTPVFKDLTNYPISSITRPSGLLIYMAGSYKTKAEADDLRQVVIAAGGSDCFVVALQNGKRIPMKRALELTK